MNRETLLIIGAAGNNGAATIAALTAQHAQHFNIRAGVRTEQRASELKSKFPLIETVILDLDQPETLSAAMQGVDKLFLILGNVENREQQAKHAIDAAVAAKSVKQVLFYSVFGAQYESILFAKQFRAGEKYLEQSGLAWTHLRTIFFQQNFAGWAEGIKDGALYLAIGEGAFAPLNIQDIGEIAANILVADGHRNKAYDITGPELLSGKQLAAAFSQQTGQSVDYVSPDNSSTLASLLAAGWPKWQAEGMLELFAVFSSNQAAVVSADGQQLLGREMTSIHQYIEQHISFFK